MRLSFEPLHDLAVEAFKSDEGADAFEYALKVEKQKMLSMFNKLLNYEEDFFIEKSEPSEINNKSLICTWTRSTRADVKIQMTVWLCNDNEKTVEALSHDDIIDFDDFSNNAKPMEGIVYGSSEKANPVLEYMEDVIPDTNYHKSSLTPAALNR